MAGYFDLTTVSSLLLCMSPQSSPFPSRLHLLDSISQILSLIVSVSPGRILLHSNLFGVSTLFNFTAPSHPLGVITF
ncbi:hypothetical protein HBI25_050040 [Parastagonospora nodorum]|nr:hypothetical protein HBH95_146760 [Parastagonospora nodorum]KAH5363880.1 hypothetical protein HBI49_114890 [Parastagonospora nodorum]KAH5521671.1 hypothetical protein HBI29_056210 [Parastagonospora nodorum]KAH5568312.1 hypothetical protein HBI25_050040 [Parastagonospora nodorum]